ncbi:MAG: hypothetical protein ABUT39_25970 [Acidobacteriota bacterium]
MPAHRRPFRSMLAATLLTFSACATSEPPPKDPPPTPNAQDICRLNGTCAGSTCPTAITGAVSAVPAEACPRYFEDQGGADIFAWNSFLALNWPADLSTCSANASASIGAPGPRVWETYALDSNVFVSSGRPQAWCSDALRASLSGPRSFGGIAKAPHSQIEKLHGIDESVGGVLTDQNGRFVRYEVRINQDEHNYLLTNNLWNKAGQASAKQAGTPINFPQGPGDSPSRCGAHPCGPVGAMEVKAAWKVLSDSEKASGRFYTTQGIVYNDENGSPSPGRNPVTLGLVGLHILHKTEKLKTWWWATFEHVDNTTTSFFNKDCRDCPANKQLAKQPYTELSPNGERLNPSTQVVRATPIETTDLNSPALNKYYQGLLRNAGSVFQNYELVSIQWATGAALNGEPAPLASTVLETYFQKNSSCMGCHKFAQTTAGQPGDFSFLLQQAH